jgi:long-chain acyl-CoA synthetase
MGRILRSKTDQGCRQINDLKDMLAQSEKLYGNKAAFRIKNAEGNYYDISYTKLKSDVDSFGTFLIKNNYKDKFIAVMGENRYEWCLTYMSVVCGTGVIVPIDKELTRTEISHLLFRSEAPVLVTSAKYLQMADEIKDEVPTLKLIISMDKTENTSFPYIYDLIDEGRSLLDSGFNDFTTAVIDRDALGILLFTSGTTDLAKGVMLSHKNICSNIVSVGTVIHIFSSDKILSILPLHHTYECTCGFLLMLYSGAAMGFNEGLKYIAKNMQEIKPTLALLVPLILESLYKKVIDTANKKYITRTLFRVLRPVSYFFSNSLKINLGKFVFAKVHRNLGGNLRLIISGAAGIDPDVSKGLRSLGFKILQGYGLTECSPIATVNHENNFNDSSIGLPIPGVDVLLTDVAGDGIGEIIVRGDNVMLGYYKNKEATDAVIKNGWLYTGDLGYTDKKGFFYISGRKKNVIVTKNGKNIFPEEVESYINKSKYILESMVWGKYEDNLQENYVHATIVPNMDAINEKFMITGPSEENIHYIIANEIKEINAALPLYKKIKSFTIQNEELQKTTTKKIKRYVNKNQ